MRYVSAARYSGAEAIKLHIYIAPTTPTTIKATTTATGFFDALAVENSRSSIRFNARFQNLISTLQSLYIVREYARSSLQGSLLSSMLLSCPAGQRQNTSCLWNACEIFFSWAAPVHVLPFPPFGDSPVIHIANTTTRKFLAHLECDVRKLYPMNLTSGRINE